MLPFGRPKASYSLIKEGIRVDFRADDSWAGDDHEGEWRLWLNESNILAVQDPEEA